MVDMESTARQVLSSPLVMLNHHLAFSKVMSSPPSRDMPNTVLLPSFFPCEHNIRSPVTPYELHHFSSSFSKNIPSILPAHRTGCRTCGSYISKQYASAFELISSLNP